MLGYRHAFHAGNHADVLKHVALAATLARLVEKPRPLLYLETHAGAGRYDLASEQARKTGEAASGVERIWQAQDAPAAVARYLKCIHAENRDGELRWYPGSPAIAARLLRGEDRMALYELHPDDCARLGAAPPAHRRVQIEQSDGLAGLRARLPPLERRALVMIDPSYELDRDYQDVPRALEDALKRFATGVYLLWYPVLAGAPVERMLRAVERAAPGSPLRIQLEPRAAGSARGLTGGGVLVINPPWKLDRDLADAVDWLRPRLAAQGTP
ncbi:MAG: 23S rRNA (adenine(2030)-N(6))-methyltransferase RlmJ [Chromatiales bacterium]|nr:23S rRNA (adenine(2030)-N(6))-methyltransferase RlmJ [Chromatiales bacterium]